jgi:hypothetical protein
MTPEQITECGGIIYNSAVEQVAKELSTDTDAVLALMHTDGSVMKRVQGYVEAGFSHIITAMQTAGA